MKYQALLISKVKKLPNYKLVDVILGTQEKACPKCNKNAVVLFSKGYKYVKCNHCGIFRIKADYKAFL